VTTDPWQLDEFDLAAYLTRIGVAELPPDRRALDELQEAHVRAFTFDNIDVLLETHQGVALPAVQEKFVARGRGGYCFEHTTLFAAALERLGYDVTRRLGRVGDPGLAPRTHAVAIVHLDGQPLLADAGFGMGPLRPIPLEGGAEDEHRGWRYRVRRAEYGWELQRLREAGWELMHTTDELTVRPVDVVMGHHFTSTFPGSHFRSGLMVTKFIEDRHVSLTHQTVTVPAHRASTAPRRRAGRPAPRAGRAAHRGRAPAAARPGRTSVGARVLAGVARLGREALGVVLLATGGLLGRRLVSRVALRSAALGDVPGAVG